MDLNNEGTKQKVKETKVSFNAVGDYHNQIITYDGYHNLILIISSLIK